ncbi:Nuclear matrix constituent protein [Musa troglodytarum]|uniref:Nuclear matrix constituent protein n=1 Tax=Musa troglodytarum TaxID=320322 RepID=A0A9E7EGU8_9LILI|nr:Nuclear matrix constituent protein [Musa troglodytarum]
MLAPQKKGLFLSPRAVAARRNWPAQSSFGNWGGVVPGRRKGREVVAGNGIPQPEELPLCGDGEDREKEQSEAQVWRRFREAGFLDEAVLQRRDREALVQRISELEKELYQYQYHMGLLLIEKKEWAVKYDKLRQEMSEAAQLQKRMQAAHIVAVAEFEKSEGNLRRAMGFQRQSIVHLEKALNDMHAEIAEVKLDSQKKLSEAHILEATIEEKCLEIKEKQHSLDARLAKVSRKSSEVDRRLEDVEAREHELFKQTSSFVAEKKAFEKDLSRQRENMRAWEEQLQDNQKKLGKWHSTQNQREMETHERDNTFRKKEKELEEAWKTLEISNELIKLKEEDMCMRIGALDAKEKEALLKQDFLEKKENELLAIEEQLNNKERVEIQKIIDFHNSILESQKDEFELETEKKKRAFDEQLQGRIEEVAHKEIILENRERELFKKEQLLEREIGNLKNREKENDIMLSAMKVSIENEKEEMRQGRGNLEKEWELLGERRLSLEEGLKQLFDEKERFDQWRCTEEERLRKENMEVSIHAQMDLEDSISDEEAFKDKTTHQKMDVLEVFNSENAHVAYEIMHRIQEKVKETLLEKEDNSNRRSNIVLNNCKILSSLDESNILKLKEQEDQLKSEKQLIVLGKKSEAGQSTPGTLSRNNKHQVVEPAGEGDYLLASAEQLKACRYCGFEDGGDTALSGGSIEVSDQGTCPGSVKLEARIPCMQRCSRLLNFSPGKKATEHSDKSVCLDGEPLEHEDNLEPGPLPGDVNAFQWAQSASGVQYNAEPERSNNDDDATKRDSQIADRSADILIFKLNDRVRDLEEPTLHSVDEQEYREGCSIRPELNSLLRPLKQKHSGRSVRRKSILVKKSRSVNALVEDASLEEASQIKHSEQSTCRAQCLIKDKCLEENYSLNDDQVTVCSKKRCLDLKYGSMSLEGERAEAHTEDVSSLGCCFQMENIPGTEIPGLKHYDFRHSTIVRAVAASQALACRTKQKRKRELESPLESKVLKVVRRDGEGAESHASASETLGSDIRNS